MSKLIKGYNDFETWCIHNKQESMLEEWDYEKNTELTPDTTFANSNKIVGWKCKKGHRWDTSVNSRTRKTKTGKYGGCPYCSGHRVLAGLNDLESQHPDIAAEWHPTKNGDLTPVQIASQSNKKAWWLGRCGHEWEARIQSRTKHKSGCPYCAGLKALAGFNDLKSKYPDLASEWHPTKNDTLTPDQVTTGSGFKAWWLCPKGHSYQTPIVNRTSRNRNCPYCSNQKVLSGENDLQSNYPKIAEEWHPTKNGNITPDQVIPGSDKKAWWKCPNGHSYYMSINHRTLKGNNCPYCGGRKLLTGFNDLQTKYPSIASEWHPTKNGSLLPTEVPALSAKKAWWLGQCGHEWEAYISNRTRRDNGCPYCSGRFAIEGETDLATLRPDLAAEWNYEKNRGLTDKLGRDISTPNKVTISSGLEVWWKCPKGHEWQLRIGTRVYMNTQCPYCVGQSTSMPEQAIAFYLEKVTSIKQRISLYGKECDIYLPQYNIGIEYDGGYYHNQKSDNDSEKELVFVNNGITFYRIIGYDNKNVVVGNHIFCTDSSLGKKFDWALAQLCKSITQITGNNAFNDIDIDSKRDALVIRERFNLLEKENSIAKMHPDIAAEWHPTKNGDLVPSMFTSGSNQKVWWKCAKGHEWQSVIANRIKGSRCPYCSGNKALAGVNDLATLRPDIAAEWHPTKNGELTPQQVKLKSNKRVWWKCSRGHEWQCVIERRTTYNSPCPFCKESIKQMSK